MLSSNPEAKPPFRCFRESEPPLLSVRILIRAVWKVGAAAGFDRGSDPGGFLQGRLVAAVRLLSGNVHPEIVGHRCAALIGLRSCGGKWEKLTMSNHLTLLFLFPMLGFILLRSQSHGQRPCSLDIFYLNNVWGVCVLENKRWGQNAGDLKS